jgi:hypothetical protein
MPEEHFSWITIARARGARTDPARRAAVDLAVAGLKLMVEEGTERAPAEGANETRAGASRGGLDEVALPS